MFKFVKFLTDGFVAQESVVGFASFRIGDFLEEMQILTSDVYVLGVVAHIDSIQF